MTGDQINQYGQGNTGKVVNSGSGNVVIGGKGLGSTAQEPPIEVLLREIERLRPHLGANDRAEVDRAAGSIATETSAERLRGLVQRITGIAALVGEVGVPVILAAKALLGV
ncbi:hypothetical protein [Kitasatospora sp. NPDC101183]|uniref:hypothetical protein n=1 Tax=Kitasatospora sp. NPDC101183 TaxID=3364100 RepID=UPI00381A771A